MKKNRRIVIKAAIAVIAFLLSFGPITLATAALAGGFDFCTEQATPSSDPFGFESGKSAQDDILSGIDTLTGMSLDDFKKLVSSGLSSFGTEDIKKLGKARLTDIDGDGYFRIGDFMTEDFKGDGCCTVSEILKYLFPEEGECSIGDFVWFDADMDGIQDENEPGINGVKVELYKWTFEYELVASTVTANHNGKPGWYSFEGLPRGLYRVKYTAPSSMEFSPANQGLNDAVDSDADPADGTTEWKLHAEFLNKNDDSIDAGVIPKTGGVSPAVFYSAGSGLILAGCACIARRKLPK